MRYLSTLSLFVVAAACQAGQPVVLEQIVSRHDPALDVARARLAVGRDGAVYLGNGHSRGAFSRSRPRSSSRSPWCSSSSG